MSVGGPPRGRSPWPVAVWAMTGLTAIALVVAVLGNVLSRTVALDALAMWPLAVLVVPAAAMGLRGGRNRALAPLVLLTWLLVTVGLHLGGLPALPSAASAVRLNLSGIQAGRLTVSIDDVELRMDAGPFEVEPLPVGGTVGAPVVEQVSGTRATALTVTDDQDRSRWFRFGAYGVSLSEGTLWDLRLRVSTVDLDLTDVALSGAQIEAVRGRILLGEPTQAATLELSGDIEVAVPSGVPVTVTGATRVPANWIVDGEDARAPTDGDGWTVRVVEGSVRIVDR